MREQGGERWRRRREEGFEFRGEAEAGFEGRTLERGVFRRVRVIVEATQGWRRRGRPVEWPRGGIEEVKDGGGFEEQEEGRKGGSVR